MHEVMLELLMNVNWISIVPVPAYLVHDGSLLLQCHGDWILVTVAVQTDLMAGISNHTTFFWERLERVSRNKPGGLDVVFFEHLQQTTDTDRSGEET